MKFLIYASLFITSFIALAAPDFKTNSQASSSNDDSSNYQKPSDEELRKRLTTLQYSVTQLDDTERPFNNDYWNEKRAGIYVDIVSGEPLFSSLHKYKSGTGWPSFYQSLDKDNIVKHDDNILFYKRTELRSRKADSHLGHLFNDGPEPTGLRYCINSASLRFIPLGDLEKEGYKQYLGIFENNAQLKQQ